MLRFHGVNGEHRPSAMTSLDARGVTCIVVSILMLGLASCDEVEATCVDSMDCAFGQACRDAKCVVVKCVSQQACVPDLELCADLIVAAQDGTRRACTAPCNVFHKCPSGQFCRDQICWYSEAGKMDADNDVEDDTVKDVQDFFDQAGADSADEPVNQDIWYPDVYLDIDDVQDDGWKPDARQDGGWFEFHTWDINFRDQYDSYFPDTNQLFDDGSVADISDVDTGPCVPNCNGNNCGLDPVCGVLNCGACQRTDECVAGKCGWKADSYTVKCGADKMCLVPSGIFWMGCNPSAGGGCDEDETPYHQVFVSAYYIDRTEVTQAEYKKCLDAGICATPSCNWSPSQTPNRPVVCTNWTRAGQYCAWAGKRLPTEAEWEKAARGTDGRRYPWGKDASSCQYAVMSDGGWGCGTNEALDVCSKSANGNSPYGLCDMAGNVWEWVSDYYDSGYYSQSPASDPAGASSGTARISRGGGFHNLDALLRTSNRNSFGPSNGFDYLGFRCVKNVP